MRHAARQTRSSEDEDSPVPSIIHRYPDRVLFLVSHLLRLLLPVLHAEAQGRRSEQDPPALHRGRDRVHPQPPRGPGRHRLGRRPADAERPEARVHPQAAAGDPPHRDHADRHAHALHPAPARHPEARGHAQEVPPALRQRPLQPPRRAHPEASRRALGLLADAGIPLGSQTVLLKGVNDDPRGHEAADAEAPGGPGAAVLHLPGRLRDRARSTSGRRSRRASRSCRPSAAGRPGWPCPYFVIDAPGGGGKIPLLPKYIQSISDEQVVLRNYAGRDLPLSQQVPAEEAEAETASDWTRTA